MKYSADEAWDDVTEPRMRAAGARVLVVDDDGDMRDLVVRRLAAEGYDVHDAVSGIELLRVIESIAVDSWPLDGIDLIVLDNRMPGLTGLDAIRRLRAAHWEMPAILMTAFPEAAVKTDAATLGVSVLAKPFSLDLLTSAILMSLVSKSVPTEREARALS